MSDELTLLKERADQLGITYKVNIGVEALKNKVNAHLVGTAEEQAAAAAAEAAEEEAQQAANQGPQASGQNPQPQIHPNGVLGLLQQPQAPQPIPAPPTREQVQQTIRENQRAEQMKLVRLRITNLNPMKANLHGEIITVVNKYVGAVKKFVPYGEATDNGYHVPYIIYQELKNRRFNSVKAKKGPNGQILPTQRLVPEFALEVLPQLTSDELRQLANAQAAAAGQGQ